MGGPHVHITPSGFERLPERLSWTAPVAPETHSSLRPEWGLLGDLGARVQFALGSPRTAVFSAMCLPEDPVAVVRSQLSPRRHGPRCSCQRLQPRAGGFLGSEGPGGALVVSGRVVRPSLPFVAGAVNTGDLSAFVLCYLLSPEKNFVWINGLCLEATQTPVSSSVNCIRVGCSGPHGGVTAVGTGTRGLPAPSHPCLVVSFCRNLVVSFSWGSFFLGDVLHGSTLRHILFNLLILFRLAFPVKQIIFSNVTFCRMPDGTFQCLKP